MKKKLMLLTVSVICATMLAVALFINQNGGWHFVAYAGGTPDGYGNKINMTRVYQDGSWVLTLVDANYTADATHTITSNQETHIQVQVYINDTLASTHAEAQSYTRVYLNVSGEFTDQSMSVYSNGTVTDFYWIWYKATANYTTGTDESKLVTAEYEAYY